MNRDRLIIAQRYWELSRAYRGDMRFAPDYNIGTLMRALTDVAGIASNRRWFKLENQAADLLQRVIQNGRYKTGKRLKRDNVVAVSFHQQNLQASQASQAKLG